MRIAFIFTYCCVHLIFDILNSFSAALTETYLSLKHIAAMYLFLFFCTFSYSHPLFSFKAAR